MTDRTSIVVGLVKGECDNVLTAASGFAQRFQSRLVCVTVDAGRYAVTEKPDGTISSLPFDPDIAFLRDEVFDEELAAHINDILKPRGVDWETRALAGDPARTLGALAERLDAPMIIVGTRRNTMRASIQEFFAGSVAAHLAHRQHRPVVVVPLDPVGPDAALPWDPV